MFLRRALPVEYARGQLAGTPMCMEQYYRLFTSHRYPGLKTDTLKVQTDASSSAPQHIIVACKNQVRNPATEDTFHSVTFLSQDSVQLRKNDIYINDYFPTHQEEKMEHIRPLEQSQQQ